MPSEKAFTLNKLLHRIEASKDSFSETFAPLTQAQIRKIQKVSAFIARPTGRHDSSRSVVVLTEIWNCTPQVFVLCALTNSPSKFFRLCREAYLQKLIAWWDRVDHPAGLAQILDKYAYILPPKRRSTTFKSGSLASPLEGTTCTDSPLGALHIPAERGIKAPEIDEAVAQLSSAIETPIEKLSLTTEGQSDASAAFPYARSSKPASGPAVAYNPDLDKLPDILGSRLYKGMEASLRLTKEREEDAKNGKPPRLVTGAVAITLADEANWDFTLHVTLGFEEGRRIWESAWPVVGDTCYPAE